MIRRLMLVFGLICNFLVASENSGLYKPKPLILPNEAERVKMQGISGDDFNPGMICSMAIVNDDFLFFCNYSRLYLLNVKTGKIKEILPPQEIQKWVPTGLKYLKNNNLLYVANYLGKNCLVFKVEEGFSLKLVKQIKDAELDGPENIDISKSTGYIAVADYNSSKIMLFDENFKKVWSRKVGQAHGVCFSQDGKFIFASGLSPAKLFKFDLKGNVVKEVGRPGWNKDGYLWPTCVACYEGGVCVSDAHTGKITVLNDNLEPKYCIGGNGSADNMLNMPYGIEFLNDSVVYVTDTFKSRLLKVDVFSGKIIKVYEGREVLYFKSHERENNKIMGDGFKERVNNKNIFYLENFLSNKSEPVQYCGNYGGVKNLNTIQCIQIPNLFFIPTAYYYWTFGKNINLNGKNYTILGSPQSFDWIIYYKGLMSVIRIGKNFWIEGESLVSDNGLSFSIQEIVQEAAQRIDTYIQNVKDGMKISEAMKMLFQNRVKNFDIQSVLPKVFTSDEGKVFYNKIKNCRNHDDIQQYVESFIESVKDKNYVSFEEVCFAKMLNVNYIKSLP